MYSSTNTIVLSRFFHENVEFVANMCPKCYEECNEVRVVGINLHFIKYLNKQFYDELLNNTIEGDTFMGFTHKELEESIDLYNKVIKLANQHENILKTLQNKDSRKNIDNSTYGTNMLNEIKANSVPKIGYIIYQKKYLTGVRNMKENKIKWKTSYKKLAEKDVKQNIFITRNKIAEYEAEEVNDEIEVERAKDKYKSKSLLSATGASDKTYSLPFISKITNKNFEDNLNSDKKEIINPSAVTSDENYSLPLITKITGDHLNSSKDKIINLTSSTLSFKNHSLPLPNKIEDGRQKQFISNFLITDFETQYFENSTTKNAISTLPWIPPKSPHNLIEESLYQDPWALLIATIFLNKTSCVIARPYVFWFLAENPTPLAVLDKFPSDFEKYFVNLGLGKTRAIAVYRMSYDFLFKKWKNVRQLYGIGDYGECAYRMFCLGDFSVEPKDRFLKIYKAWHEKICDLKGFS